MSVTTPLYSLHIRLSHYGRVRRLFYPCPNEVTVTKIKQDTARLFSLTDNNDANDDRQFRLFFRAPFGTADDIVVNDDENLQKVIEICNPDQGDLAKQTCCYLNLIVEQLSTSNSHLGYNGSTNVSQTTLTTDVPTKGDLAAVEDQLSMIYKKINELGESIASNAYSRSSDSTATATTTTTAMPQLDTSVMIDELGGVPNSQLFLLEQQALELAAEIREKSQRIVNGATDIASVIASASAVAAVTAAERAASSEPAPTVDNNDREEQLSVMCDGCGELVDGHWYHCMHCSDFDFCQSCYSSLTVRQHHPMHHGFKRTEQARTTAPVPCPTPSAPPAVAPVYHQAWCDFCDTMIAGHRYKCQQCADFDLCSKCIGRAVSHSTRHTYTVIEKPDTDDRSHINSNPYIQSTTKTTPTTARCQTRTSSSTCRSRSSRNNNWTQAYTDTVRHLNVVCDHCNCRIVGTRYKCGNCLDFDLCSSCEASSTHQHDAEHVFLKIKRPLPSPLATKTALLPSLYVRKPISLSSFINRSVVSVLSGNEDRSGTPTPSTKPNPSVINNNNNNNMPTTQSESTGEKTEEIICDRDVSERQSMSQLPGSFASLSRSIASSFTTIGSSIRSTASYHGTFINDASTEDGTVIMAGEKFIKSWTVANQGDSSWPENTRLICVGGESMGSVTATTVPSLAAGQQAVLSVDLVAPQQIGLKTSYWRLVAPNGSRFGDHLWCEISVTKPIVTEEAEASKEESATTEEVAKDATPTVDRVEPITQENHLSHSALLVIPTLSFSNMNTDDEDAMSTTTTCSSDLTNRSAYASETSSVPSGASSLHMEPEPFNTSSITIQTAQWSNSDIESDNYYQEEQDLHPIVWESDDNHSETASIANQEEEVTAEAETDNESVFDDCASISTTNEPVEIEVEQPIDTEEEEEEEEEENSMASKVSKYEMYEREVYEMYEDNEEEEQEQEEDEEDEEKVKEETKEDEDEDKDEEVKEETKDEEDEEGEEDTHTDAELESITSESAFSEDFEVINSDVWDPPTL